MKYKLELSCHMSMATEGVETVLGFGDANIDEYVLMRKRLGLNTPFAFSDGDLGGEGHYERVDGHGNSAQRAYSWELYHVDGVMFHLELEKNRSRVDRLAPAFAVRGLEKLLDLEAYLKDSQSVDHYRGIDFSIRIIHPDAKLREAVMEKISDVFHVTEEDEEE